MTKSTEIFISVPTIRLSGYELHFPNITTTVTVSKEQVMQIYNAYANSKLNPSTTTKALSIIQSLNIKDESVKGFNSNTISTLRDFNKRDDANVIIVATYNEQCKRSTIARVEDVRKSKLGYVLTLNGITTGSPVDKLPSDLGELLISVNEDNNIGDIDVSELRKDIVDCIKLTEKFEHDFKNVKDGFKELLFKLTPLANILHIQLSSTITKDKLTQLKLNAFKWNVGVLCDAFISFFPFTFDQKKKYLDLSDVASRIEYVNSLVEFVKSLFTQHLDISYVYESWLRIGKLDNGKALQSEFIISHFKTLKKLLDLTTKTQTKSIVVSPKINRPANFDDDNDLDNIEKFINSLEDLEISQDGKTMLTKDFRRLKKMQPSSTEYQQLNNYFDIIRDLPWSKPIPGDADLKNIDLDKAKQILDNEHFGMEPVKERILEFIAISKLTSINAGSSKSPIILLNGPPGVGKTSLAKSIARSLNYEFQRISLGGINDFTELKGHRRTYVGANPGLLVQAFRKSKTKTMKLVILLDEIDKIGNLSNKGNPEAALLEILDPEQNSSFNDHYVGFPIDLSNVVFIATSNNKWDISEPLLDRMETIDLDGYSIKEKIEIAKRYVVARQMKRNGLENSKLVIENDVILNIVHLYTHESGVRNLERLIGKICRKKAIELLTLETFNPVVCKNDLIKYLGVPTSLSNAEKYSSGDSVIQERYGMVNGLSYNSDGSGSLLKFEMVGVPGGQSISTTGMLGEVLLESCNIAETLVEQLIHTHEFGNKDSNKLIERLQNTSVHMHVPQGSIRKDGPSAGLTMTLCYLSLILQMPVPANIAMTGEITLTAKALPIGGLKEKLLGAGMTGMIDKVIVPRLNRQDLISAYAESITDKDESNIALTRLVLEEESCLSKPTKRYSFAKDVEDWILKEYGIEIKYVDDFMDVIKYVWDDKLQISRKELKAHL